MRILFISSLFPNRFQPTNGIFVLEQVKSLIKAGCEVKVISPKPFTPSFLWFNKKWREYGQIPNQYEIEGVQVQVVRYIRPPSRLFHSISSVILNFILWARVKSIFKEWQPDIIHAQTATPIGAASLPIAKKLEIPFVCSILGSDINIYPFYDKFSMELTKRVLLGSDKVISVSRALKNEALKITPKCNKIEVIYDGCDLSKFMFVSEARNSLREELNIYKDQKCLLFVGSLKKEKGVYDLWHVFVRLCEKCSKLKLIYVGGGGEFSKLTELIEKSSFNNKAILMGPQPHQVINRWMSVSDIFVFPSYYEGLPNVVLEAMACQRPVVATNVGGIPEAVENGKSGILVNQGDLQGLYNALLELIYDDVKSENMGCYGNSLIKKKFLWEMHAKNLKNIYEQINKKNL